MAVWREVRIAVRRLGQERSFTLAVVGTLGIGIGATTAVFSAVNGVLIRPLPYPDADRIVQIASYGPASRGAVLSFPYFTGLRERSTTLSAVGGYDSFSNITRQRLATTVERADGAVRLLGTRISPVLFPMLGIQPLFGRWFDIAEEQPQRHAVIILSHRAWQNAYGGDPGILGRFVALDGRSCAVIGVMPADFGFPDVETDFWIPLTPALLPPPTAARSDSPNTYYADAVFGRLAAGVSPDVAGREVDAILRGIDLELAPERGRLGDTYRAQAALPRRAEVVLMKDELVASIRPALRIWSVAVALVLLIACANIVNLLLVRSGSRAREMAIRAALGAGPGRLIRHVLTDTLLLALAGGTLGIALAYCAVRVALRAAPAGMPRVDDIGMNLPVMAFALAVSTFTGAAVAVIPALRVLRANPMHALMARLGQRQGRLGPRGLIVAGQVALTTMLLIGAGLLIRSFVTLTTVNPGYDPRGVLTFQLVLPTGYGRDPQLIYDELLLRLESIQTVQAAGSTDVLPVVGSSAFRLSIPGLPVPPAPGDTMVMRVVQGDYFKAMGIRLVEGRTFAEQDRGRTPEPIVVNREFVRRYFGGKSPVGATVGQAPANYEVVGVIDDVRHAGLHSSAEPEYYVDLRNTALAETVRPYFVLRARDTSTRIAAAVRGVVAQVDPLLGVELNIAGMAAIVSQSVSRPRFQTLLLTGFAAAALVLAAVGLYGVVAFSVEQRTREIGIRIAVGATRGDVMRLILRQGAAITAAGTVCGVAAAAGATRYLEGMLFGVRPLDPVTFLAGPLTFAVIAALAAYLPARRAMQVDPVVALRSD